MALQSMTALASITLQQASASVSFSGIPQNYRDLVLVSTVRNTYAGTGNDGFEYRFNGDSGLNYNWVRMFGIGSGSGSSSASSNVGILSVGRLNEGNTTANTFSLNTIQIMDYAATDKHKVTISRSNIPNDSVWAWAGRWASTAALNSIVVTTPNGQLATGSTFNLYGRIA
jgi:hypothetical protein